MPNVQTRVACAYDLSLRDGSVHRAFLVTVLSITGEFLVPGCALARTTIG